jgi:hypothetical protein
VTPGTSFAITPDGTCTGTSCTATMADGGSSHHTVTGTDGTKTGTTSLTINPALTTQLVFSALSSTATINSPTTFTLTAEDAYANVTPAYRGTDHFTSTDLAASVPLDYTFTATDNGVHTGFSITFQTAGTQTISASDVATGSTITGKSSPVSVT